jgi:hypothetical protein
VPDPVASQNLYDALKAFMASPATHSSLYSFAKDFQTLGAGILALIAATVAYRGAVNSASKAYRGVMDKIVADRDIAETKLAFDREIAAGERKAALRNQQSRKYSMFLRLRYEVRHLKKDTSLILLKLEPTIRAKQGQLERLEPTRLMTDPKAEYVKWEDGLSFGEYNELEKAWRKIDLFSLSNIFLVDNLRGGLDDAKEKETWCLRGKDEDGNVPLVNMKLYRDSCLTVQRQAQQLLDGLKKPTKELATLAGFAGEADQ